MKDRPLWRKWFDAADNAAGPRLERLVRSEGFAVAVGLGGTIQCDLARRTEQASRRAWHLLNLPAGSDVNRLCVQIGSLERQVRELEKRLTDAKPYEQEVTTLAPPRAAGRGHRAHPS